jgi:putative ABC transport system ATP-binding protein
VTPRDTTGSRTTPDRAATAWAAASRAAAGGGAAPVPVPAVVCRDVVRFYRLDSSPGGRTRDLADPDVPDIRPGRPDVLGGGAVRAVPALRGVDLDLAAGTVTALVGPSGSGKSTLLRLLACVDRADGGTIEIDGIDVGRLSRRGRVRLRRHRLGFMFQSPADNLLEYLTVRQHLELGAQLRGLSKKNGQVDELLDRLGLADRAGHLPRQLSGGEQQRVAIAFASLGPPALLVADEPTGQLDHSTVDSVLDAFEVLAATGVAVVAATHDPSVARRADRVVYLRDGRVEEGSRWT